MRNKHICVAIVSLCVAVGVTVVALAEKKPNYSTETINTQAKIPSVPIVTQELDTLYFWDFEDGAGGFTCKNMSDIGAMWHTTDEYWTYDGSNAWWCGTPRDAANNFSDVWGYGSAWSQTLDMEQAVNLSGTSNPVLSFDARWSCEGSDFNTYADCFVDGILQGDWDGLVVYVSTDGGATYPPENFILPTDLTHVCVCGTLYSHQVATGYFVPGGIKGLNGNSEGWRHMEYPLDNYKTGNVVLRMHFCSDECLSTFDEYSCGQDTSFHGFFIDNISVDDGGSNIFFDNGDDEIHLVPSVTSRNNIWHYVDGAADAPSPTHAWVADADDEWNLESVWLESPWFEIPEGWFPELRYWFKCDMPDFDGDHDTDLEDYYEVHISEDGMAWTALYHHWPRMTEGFSDITGYDQTCHFETWWSYVNDDLMYNGRMTLWNYSGRTVKLRWLTHSDTNDDCGNGTGLWLDNIEIVGRESAPYDMGVDRIDYSTPNAVGSQTRVTLTIRNFGQLKAYGYFFYQILDEENNEVIPLTPGVADSFEIGEIRKIYFDWTPAAAGLYRVLAFLFAGEDYYGPNDSLYSAWVNVFPANGGALFDHHFLTGNASGFGDGNGVAVHLFPPHWLGTYRITEGAVRYNSGEGPYTVNIFTGPFSDTEDTIDYPGDGVELLAAVSTHTDESTLDDWPIPDVPSGFGLWGQDWYGVDLSGEENLKCMEGDVFLFIQHGEGHSGLIPCYEDPDPPSGCFTYDSESFRFIRSDDDYALRLGIAWPGNCGCMCQGRRGDPTGDGEINILDALAAVNHILGMVELEGDGFCCSDCNSDGTLNVLDVLGIVNVILGFDQCRPVGAKAVLGTSQATVWAETVSSDHSVEVNISLSSEISMAGAQFDLKYNATKVVPVQVTLSARCEGMEMFYHTRSGELRVVLYSPDGLAIDAYEGELVKVSFKVIDTGDPELTFGEVLLAHSCTEAIFPEVRSIVFKGMVSVEYGLVQNYPNPFNPATCIEYSVAGNVRATLKVYNILGQELVTLVDEVKVPGAYTLVWDATDVASGVYLYRLTAGDYTATRQMVLLK